MAGPGSVATYDSYFGYQLNGIHIDWTDMTKLWRFGTPLYIEGHNVGPSKFCTDSIYVPLWQRIKSYLPLKLRITVVAVAAGYSFSGWSKYISVCTPAKQPAPAYGIDYTNRTTDKIVSSTDEYSYNSDMSGSVSGTGQKLLLTPGQSVYFRTKKVNDCILASDIQSLIVPSSPNAPSVTINYLSEQTSAIPTTIEWSTYASMASPTTGINAAVTVTPGTDLYFRVKSTLSSFASSVQSLDVPARASGPSVSIDFRNETTTETIGSLVEYSTSPSFSSPVTGNGSKVAVTPGQDMYFRTKATAGSFKSAGTHLIISGRPAAPSISINYVNEITSDVPSSIEWSTNASMISAITGADVSIEVTPGTNLFFRKKATESNFCSGIQVLSMPLRPESPVYSIDYVNERTYEAVPSGDEYSNVPDMTGAQTGSDVAIQLEPGNDTYFRVKHTQSAFNSEVFHLVVPERPVIYTLAADTIQSEFFTAYVDFHEMATGLNVEDIEAVNASIQLLDVDSIKILPLITGDVIIQIIANAVMKGNFASEPIKKYYREVVSVIPHQYDVNAFLLIYPNPVSDELHLKCVQDQLLPVQIELTDAIGTVILRKKMESAIETIYLNNYPQGLYILDLIDAEGGAAAFKVIKE